jgi:hypothetical protein
MPQIIPLDHADVVQGLTLIGDPEAMAVTYGVKLDATQLPTTPGALAIDLRTAFKDAMTTFFHPDFRIADTTVRWQDTLPPNPPSIGVASGSTPGLGAAGTLLPQNSSFLVHKNTSQGGPRGRGRFYLPSVYESQANNLGQIDSGTIAALNGSVGTFLANVLALPSVLSMVILHDSLGISAPGAPTIIQSLSTDPVIATQRRRLRK